MGLLLSQKKVDIEPFFFFFSFFCSAVSACLSVSWGVMFFCLSVGSVAFKLFWSLSAWLSVSCWSLFLFSVCYVAFKWLTAFVCMSLCRVELYFWLSVMLLSNCQGKLLRQIVKANCQGNLLRRLSACLSVSCWSVFDYGLCFFPSVCPPAFCVVFLFVCLPVWVYVHMAVPVLICTGLRSPV